MAEGATRVHREYIWPRNWHMVFGRQWMRWNPAAKRFFALPPRPERSCTSNQLIGRVAHMVARMLSNRPVFAVLAQNDTPDARRAAVIGEKVLEFDWSDLKLFQSRYFAALHMILFGFGLMKYWWDPHAGKVGRKEREVFSPSGVKFTELSREYEYKGAIRVIAADPSGFRVPPGIYWPDISEAPWVGHEVLMTPEEVKLRYGVDVNPEENAGSGFAESLSADVDRFTYYGYAGDTRRTGRVRVREYYERPTPHKGYERGLVETVCQGKVLASEEAQFDDGRFPFAMFIGMPEPGFHIPHAWASDLVGPQVHYNQMLSRLDTWAALAFYPKILNPQSAGIPNHHFRSGGFEILDYNDMQGATPTWWAPPPIPGQAFAHLELGVKDLDRVSSQFGFGRGEPQGGAPSGALAQVMIEADSTELGPLITLHAREWERLGQGLLELHRRYDPPEKLIVLTGSSGHEVLSYKRTDIPVGLQVSVQEDSLQPRIRATRKQELLAMLQTGLFGPPGNLPPKTRLKLLEWAGHPTATVAKDADMLERELCDAENLLLIEMGQEVEVAPTDDHEVHLTAHRERTLMKDRFTWGSSTPDPKTGEIASPVWARLMRHISGHQQAIDQAQQQQMEQQQAMVQMQTDSEIQQIQARADADLRNKVTEIGAEAIVDSAKGGEEQPEGEGQEGGGDDGPA